MSEIHFADLSYPQVQALLDAERTTVLLFPVGATEPHGPHSPLATDMVISTGICERVARALADDPELRALVLPALSFGVTRFAGAFPGAVHVEEETLRAVVVDVVRSFARQGFPHVVLVNNHFEPEHVRTLHHALDGLEAEGIRAGYLDLTRKERATRLTEEFRLGECHAGRYETSLVLADRPELVDLDRAAGLPYVPVNMAAAIGGGVKEFREMGLVEAYCGSPAEATADEGEESFAILAEMTIELIRALVDGTGGRDRSGLFGRV